MGGSVTENSEMGKRQRLLPLRKTVTSVLIETHYQNLLIIERWTWERFVRLAKFFQFTPLELGSLVMMDGNALQRYRKNNLPPIRSAALLLTMLEFNVMKNWTDDVIANPFPQFPDTE